MAKHIDGGNILRFNVQANYEAATVLPEYVYLPILPSDNMLLFNTAAFPLSDKQPLFQTTNTILTTLFCTVMTK